MKRFFSPLSGDNHDAQPAKKRLISVFSAIRDAFTQPKSEPKKGDSAPSSENNNVSNEELPNSFVSQKRRMSIQNSIRRQSLAVPRKSVSGPSTNGLLESIYSSVENEQNINQLDGEAERLGPDPEKQLIREFSPSVYVPKTRTFPSLSRQNSNYGSENGNGSEIISVNISENGVPPAFSNQNYASAYEDEHGNVVRPPFISLNPRERYELLQMKKSVEASEFLQSRLKYMVDPDETISVHRPQNKVDSSTQTYTQEHLQKSLNFASARTAALKRRQQRQTKRRSGFFSGEFYYDQKPVEPPKQTDSKFHGVLGSVTKPEFPKSVEKKTEVLFPDAESRQNPLKTRGSVSSRPGLEDALRFGKPQETLDETPAEQAAKISSTFKLKDQPLATKASTVGPSSGFKFDVPSEKITAIFETSAKGEKASAENSKPNPPTSLFGSAASTSSDAQAGEKSTTSLFGSASGTMSSGPLFGSIGGEKPAFAPGPAPSKESQEKTEKPAISFSFGKVPSAPVGSGTDKEEPKKPLFGFAAPSEPAESTAKKLPAFSFGQKDDTGSNKPSFSFGKPADTADKPAFSINQKSDSSDAKPAFSFGQKPDSDAKPAFSFGKKAEDNNEKPSISFGKKPENGDAKPTLSFGQKADDASAKPMFSFGQKSDGDGAKSAPLFGEKTEKSDSKPAFSFGDKTATKAPFSFGSTSSSTDKPPAFAFGKSAPPVQFGAAPKDKASEKEGAASDEKDDREPKSSQSEETQPKPLPKFNFGSLSKTPQILSDSPDSRPTTAGTLGSFSASGERVDEEKEEKEESAPKRKAPGFASNPLFSAASSATPGPAEKTSNSTPASGGLFGQSASLTPAGANADTPSPKKRSAGLFSGGGDGGAAKPAEAPKFSFGQSAAPAKDTPKFSFGAAPAETPKFAFGQTPAPAKEAPAFSFGASTKPGEHDASQSASTGLKRPAPGGFSFGGSSTASSEPTPAPSFPFANPNAPQSAGSPSAFNFGSSATADPASIFGASGANAPAPAFSFSAPANPAVPAAPFGAAPAAASGFSFSNKALSAFGGSRPGTPVNSNLNANNAGPGAGFGGFNNATAPSSVFGGVSRSATPTSGVTSGGFGQNTGAPFGNAAPQPGGFSFSGQAMGGAAFNSAPGSFGQASRENTPPAFGNPMVPGAMGGMGAGAGAGAGAPVPLISANTVKRPLARMRQRGRR